MRRTKLKIVSYNIHKCIGGVDRRYRPERIVETLLHYEPDCVLLQEVDDGVPRSRFDRQVDLLGDALEMEHREFQKNVQLKRGHYGNAILSKFPIKHVENIDLTVRFKKRRQALMARCQIRDREHTHTFYLVSLHLGLAGFERQIQLRNLINHHSLTSVHRTTPVIIGGDFNDVWNSLGKKVMSPVGFQPVSKSIKTFPAMAPVRPLDQLYYRGEIEKIHALAGHTKTAKQASDHRPLVAEFEMRWTL